MDPLIRTLKACPFCGCDRTVWTDDGFRWGRLECADCGAMGPEVRIATIGVKRDEALDSAKQRAAERWDTRRET